MMFWAERSQQHFTAWSRWGTEVELTRRVLTRSRPGHTQMTKERSEAATTFECADWSALSAGDLSPPNASECNGYSTSR